VSTLRVQGNSPRSAFGFGWPAFAIALTLVVLFTLSLSLGSAPIGLANTARWLAHSLGFGPAPGPSWQATVLWSLRLPRVLLAFLAGAALSVAGAALQGLSRNPLAEPGILGTSAGGACGAVLALGLGLATRQPYAVPLLAAGGALGATALVLLSQRRRQDSARLLLTGVALGSLFSGATSFVVSQTLDDWDKGRQIAQWLLGSLEGKTYAELRLLVPGLAFGLPLIYTQARNLDALLLGEQEAEALGVPLQRVSRLVVLGTALVVGCTVASCGIIGFVGLVAPHVARKWVGPLHQKLLPAAFVIGGVLVMACDLIARTLLAPKELHLGVVTAALGAPVLLWIIRKRSTLSS
jgi:iron complex transport system permease protein